MKGLDDIYPQKVGDLTILGVRPKVDSKGRIRLVSTVLCWCGTMFECQRHDNILSGAVTSCGCNKASHKEANKVYRQFIDTKLNNYRTQLEVELQDIKPR